MLADMSFPPRIEDFDSYDRYLLWTALNAGHPYARVKNGPKGYWVVDLPAAPGDLPEPVPGRIIGLGEIEGLTGSSRQPFVEPGPWLQSTAERLLPSDPNV